LREEIDMFIRSQENNSVSSGGYWDEYSDASESSIERHGDPKHSRRITAWTREKKPYEKHKRPPIR
jgi:predicted HD phosphohydrolase